MRSDPHSLARIVLAVVLCAAALPAARSTGTPQAEPEEVSFTEEFLAYIGEQCVDERRSR